jgi:hypothetical protein
MPNDPSIMRYLREILTKVDHQTEALDLILPEAAQLNPEAVARARAILARARGNLGRPHLRALKPQTEAHPADPLA